MSGPECFWLEDTGAHVGVAEFEQRPADDRFGPELMVFHPDDDVECFVFMGADAGSVATFAEAVAEWADAYAAWAAEREPRTGGGS